MPNRLQQHTWKLLASCWFALTTYLLVIPGDALPKTNLISIPYFDKLVHIGLFAILSALWLKSLKNRSITIDLIVVLGTIAYGVAMEFVQRDFVANRSFDVMDIMADSVGAVLGFALVAAKAKNNSS
jgi:VanZ family protein